MILTITLIKTNLHRVPYCESVAEKEFRRQIKLYYKISQFGPMMTDDLLYL